VAGVSLALALARPVEPQAAGSVQSDLPLVQGGRVAGSAGPQLYAYFNADTPPADYVVVDLGEGRRWLSSRLYLLSVLAARQRGVAQIVFVREGAYPDEFFGVATTDAVAAALVVAEPDLEAAMAWSLYSAHKMAGGPLLDIVPPAYPGGMRIPLGHGARFTTDGPLNMLVDTYIAALRASAPAGRPDEPGWVVFPGMRERASWVEPTHLARLLGPDLETDTASWERRSDPETADAARETGSAAVALVDEHRRFRALADPWMPADPGRPAASPRRAR
jgi:hypothetical protein